MIPIGRGQRELIIGDRATGKIDDRDRHDHQPGALEQGGRGRQAEGLSSALLHLRRHRPEEVQRRPHRSRCSKKNGAMPYTTIISAPASDSATNQYLAPFAGAAMGEWFMDNGMDALIIYDDLSKHAVAYRQVSLVLKRPSGREAYPGDVFYLHSRLLERSARVTRRIWRRLAYRVADHRDAGGRRVGVHSDKRHLDHRRSDLSGDRSVLSRRSPGDFRRSCR